MVMVKTGRPITYLSFQHFYGMFFSSAHTRPDFFMFQDNSVVNETNVFWRIVGLWPFLAQQVENSGGQDSEFTILNELA